MIGLKWSLLFRQHLPFFCTLRQWQIISRLLFVASCEKIHIQGLPLFLSDQFLNVCSCLLPMNCIYFLIFSPDCSFPKCLCHHFYLASPCRFLQNMAQLLKSCFPLLT